jgi:lipopolysaccharide/colanic/teichoic acid biosynthesis glycosyltransferase
MSSVGLLCLAPLFVTIGLLIKLDSAGPVFFRQERVGRRFRPFRIYKFRTMVQDAAARGAAITCGEDPRITRIGGLLRRTKLDELPQLVNVLRGEMSIVGPRPEVPRYVELFRDDYDELLAVRPGITDPASLRFRNEAEMLGRTPDPHETYVKQILPEKVGLSKSYARHASLASDVWLILKTLTRVSRTRVP